MQVTHSWWQRSSSNRHAVDDDRRPLEAVNSAIDEASSIDIELESASMSSAYRVPTPAPKSTTTMIATTTTIAGSSTSEPPKDVSSTSGMATVSSIPGQPGMTVIISGQLDNTSNAASSGAPTPSTTAGAEHMVPIPGGAKTVHIDYSYPGPIDEQTAAGIAGQSATTTAAVPTTKVTYIDAVTGDQNGVQHEYSITRSGLTPEQWAAASAGKPGAKAANKTSTVANKSTSIAIATTSTTPEPSIIVSADTSQGLSSTLAATSVPPEHVVTPAPPSLAPASSTSAAADIAVSTIETSAPPASSSAPPASSSVPPATSSAPPTIEESAPPASSSAPPASSSSISESIAPSLAPLTTSAAADIVEASAAPAIDASFLPTPAPLPTIEASAAPGSSATTSESIASSLAPLASSSYETTSVPTTATEAPPASSSYETTAVPTTATTAGDQVGAVIEDLEEPHESDTEQMAEISTAKYR